MTTDSVRTRDLELLHSLESVVETNLERHLAAAKEWMPHDYVPWSEGRDFAFLGGEDWRPEDSRLDPVAKAAMIINLLTEDNLPSYHREVAVAFGRGGAWGEWVNRWTAEEARHSIALRDYLVVTRGVDPVELERRRMAHMQTGYAGTTDSVVRDLAYVSFQELATRVSHRNTGRATGCPVADRLLTRISTDENLHMVFYRNLLQAALEIQPNETLQAIRDEVIGFEMPGSAEPDFARSSVAIAKAGIYDLRLHHDEVVTPVLRFWRVFELASLSAEGERAREELAEFLALLDHKADRFVEQRDRLLARQAAQRERLAG
ncbi:acyl-ACP desaturase [Streptacidiphilus pinicola]|uniref:Acyl-ACP desaturase n=1 Tax=Streptacidiphilus pinicola TaxID=2219663 RepID=A0A2X0KFX7_9ACTN|nr:acyl-ACP desaturase [Streptacidiphilus pinicola]RAG85999.1 acyl-ACP desaturase [Streptacidiphilus pinicola]